MNKNTVIGIVVASVVLIGGFMLYQSTKTSSPLAATPTPDLSNQTAAPAMAQQDASSSSSSATTGTVKEITVTGSNFKFEPSTISVNKGDTIKVTFNNSQGFHDIVFPDFNAQSKTIAAGKTDTITFTADKTGSFEYFCSVGNHKAMGMVGTLTVQ